MSLLEILSKEIGVKEVKGKQHSPQIMKYAKEAGFENYISDETAWCSLFANWVALKAGLEQSNNLAARSWLNIGLPIDNPEPGDIVVFWRNKIDSWQGHVAFFMGFSHDYQRVYCVGGNQGNQVTLTAYEKKQLLGFRRLRKTTVPEFSNKNIDLGDNGAEVVLLQDTLKQLGYDCGTSDGVFGNKTRDALKEFQSTSETMKINGKFDKATREYLIEILKANSRV